MEILNIQILEIIGENKIIDIIKKIIEVGTSILISITILTAIIRGIFLGIKIMNSNGSERTEAIKSLKWFLIGMIIICTAEVIVLTIVKTIDQIIK